MSTSPGAAPSSASLAAQARLLMDYWEAPDLGAVCPLEIGGEGWTNRWLGGFCSLGASGGLPVREADYPASPPLSSLLTLPAGAVPSAGTQEDARAAWSEFLGGAPVALARNLGVARRALLLASGIERGALVALPANASLALAESVKRHGARPRFLDLDDGMALVADPARLEGVSLVWAQPPVGLACPVEPLAGLPLWVDASDALPSGAPSGTGAALTLWGLHLSEHPDDAGALIAFHDRESAAGRALAERVVALLASAEMAPGAGRAMAQLRRLTGDGGPGLAARQRANLAEVWQGIRDAALLDMPPPDGASLAHSVAVRIPDETEPATFVAYVVGENTPVQRMSDVRPLNYAALQERRDRTALATAERLARWLLVPVGPDMRPEEIAHAVLGVVKAADYLGVRFHRDSARAREYAALMTAKYGPDHDAYRPFFLTPDAAAR
ncbi:MAG: hypothetical protein NTZ05_03280 [Chloroflexi bacterium]|nr:hypothetical protein [Chloroflexota bacterium]